MEPTTEPQRETQQASRWEDFVDIFISPAAVYRRRADDSWTTPWLVLSALGIVLYYAFLPANKILMKEVFRQSAAGANPAAAQTAEKVGDTMQILGGVFVPVGFLVTILFTGFLLWACLKALGGDIALKRAFLIPAYSGVIALIQQVVVSVLVIMKDNAGETLDVVRDTSVSVLRLLPSDVVPAALVPLVGRIEIFAIWQMVLWAIGLQVLARCTRGQAYGAAAGAWLLYAIPGVIKALFAKTPAS
jgi:hypothetical protein